MSAAAEMLWKSAQTCLANLGPPQGDGLKAGVFLPLSIDLARAAGLLFRWRGHAVTLRVVFVRPSVERPWAARDHQWFGVPKRGHPKPLTAVRDGWPAELQGEAANLAGEAEVTS